MKISHIPNKIAGAILGLTIVFGIGICSSTTGHAQDPYGNGNQDRRNWDRYGNYGGSSDLRQTALNAGYNEGNKQGQNDRNRSNGNNYQNQSAYRKATKDYSSRLGDRELYRRYFRDAYKTGYRDGLNGS